MKPVKCVQWKEMDIFFFLFVCFWFSLQNLLFCLFFIMRNRMSIRVLMGSTFKFCFCSCFYFMPLKFNKSANGE